MANQITSWEDVDLIRDEIEGRHFSTGKLTPPRWLNRPVNLPNRRHFDYVMNAVKKSQKNK